MRRFEKKVGIVTGASSGIGRATALKLAREGARLVVTARRASLLDELVAELQEMGAQAVAVPGDVTTEALAASLVSTAVSHFGQLDFALRGRMQSSRL